MTSFAAPSAEFSTLVSPGCPHLVRSASGRVVLIRPPLGVHGGAQLVRGAMDLIPIDRGSPSSPALRKAPPSSLSSTRGVVGSDLGSDLIDPGAPGSALRVYRAMRGAIGVSPSGGRLMSCSIIRVVPGCVPLFDFVIRRVVPNGPPLAVDGAPLSDGFICHVLIVCGSQVPSTGLERVRAPSS